jgi:flagella basal body P-ring formation protein FlgA
MRIIQAISSLLFMTQLGYASDGARWGAEDLRRELVQWFAKQGHEAPVAESIGPLDPRLSVAACANLSIVPRSAAGSSFLMTCASPTAWRYVLSTDARGVANPPQLQKEQGGEEKRWPVIVAKGTLSTGMILTNDLIEETLQTNVPPGQALKALSQAIGMRLTTGVTSGAVLTTRNVMKSPLVMKGETVNLLAAGQGFEIATPARAEEDGYEGDLISVKNIRTGAPMKGRLQRDKTVVVVRF